MESIKNKPTPLQTDSFKDSTQTCPNCGKELLERKCKLICPNPQCGFHISCADMV